MDAYVYNLKNSSLQKNIKDSRFRITFFKFSLGDVQCFGEDCYALAFGVPGLLMVIALGKSSGAEATNNH